MDPEEMVELSSLVELPVAELTNADCFVYFSSCTLLIFLPNIFHTINTNDTCFSLLSHS